MYNITNIMLFLEFVSKHVNLNSQELCRSCIIHLVPTLLHTLFQISVRLIINLFEFLVVWFNIELASVLIKQKKTQDSIKNIAS